MSYDISDWKTKSLLGFCLPIKEIMKTVEGVGSPSWVIDSLSGMTTFTWAKGIKIKGYSNAGKVLVVTSIRCRGEGSGWIWHKALEPLMEQSRGLLVATRVWERGDFIDTLTVKNGILTSEKVEL